MIYGIGTDIADIRRVAGVLERQGERFVKRILGPQERVMWQQRSARSADRGVRFLATRFSAKEAFSKAIGLGMHMPMAWSRCEILNDASGKPVIQLQGDLAAWFENQRLKASVSLSDEAHYAVSFVVVEQLTPPFSSQP